MAPRSALTSRLTTTLAVGFGVCTVVTTVMLLGAWSDLSACRQSGAILHADAGSAAALSLAVRQSELIRNLTLRVRTAENAIQWLRKQSALHQAPRAAAAAVPLASAAVSLASVAAVEEDPAAEAPGGGATGAGDGAASGGGDGGEESEDKEEGGGKTEEQLEAERVEQHKLIKYDEAKKTFQRVRPDYKCGAAVPLLPDDELVECDHKGSHPCCSALGWCGKTKQHCRCPTCIDWRKEKRKRDHL